MSKIEIIGTFKSPLRESWSIGPLGVKIVNQKFNVMNIYCTSEDALNPILTYNENIGHAMCKL